MQISKTTTEGKTIPLRLACSIVVTILLLGIALFPVSSPRSASARQIKRGDFGGEMDFISRFYSPPQGPHESNHFIDLWSGGAMAEFARAHGLTNNRALFIISHGRGRASGGKWQYALYPAESQLSKGAKTPYYSARDVVRLLGTQTAEQIDNLIISGCNAENSLDLREWKACFPNATNIIHAAAGKDGYDFLLRHVMLYPSAELKWLYSTQDSFSPETKAKLPAKLNLYMASLYRRGENEPFAEQIAGRELLQPSSIQAATALAMAPVPRVELAPTASASAASLPNTVTRQPIIIRPAPPLAKVSKPKADLKQSTDRAVLLACIGGVLGLLVLIAGLWLAILEVRSGMPQHYSER